MFDEFYLLSEDLFEYPWDMMCEIYDNGKFSIWSSPCGYNNWYFKIFNKEVDKFCRISMTEPKILRYDDELLELDIEDINEIIYALTNNTNKNKYGWTGWIRIIYQYNITGPHFPIPEDLPMPDYSLLKNRSTGIIYP